jgi:hypothetical protein
MDFLDHHAVPKRYRWKINKLRETFDFYSMPLRDSWSPCLSPGRCSPSATVKVYLLAGIEIPAAARAAKVRVGD